MKTMILAHRGASAYRPENTLEAFTLAMEQGADGFELDVHLTKDGEIVVAHDERLERVSDGSGHINDYTLKELKEFNFGKLFPNAGICRVPSLEEVFSLVKNTRHFINVELKGEERLYHELPQKLLVLAKEYDMEDRILYSSFNHYYMRDIKKIDKTAKTALLYSFGLIDPWVYAKYANANAINPHYSIVAALPETVEHCHENGIKVNVWTVDDPKHIETMLGSKVDAIISNKPDVAISCVE